jgi:hypothetical protein
LWNAKGRRRKRKPREEWMNGIEISMISKERPHIRRSRRKRNMEEQNFFGMKNTYHIAEQSSTTKGS